MFSWGRMENDLNAFMKDGPLHCKMFNNVLVSCHLVESSTPQLQLWHQRMSPDKTKFPRRTVPIGNHRSMSWVQLLSLVWLFVTPWTVACQVSWSITNSWSLLKLLSIESVMPSNYLILCLPFLFLPSIFPSIRVFSNESSLHIRWPKYRSFNFSISPSNEQSGLISFRMDWLDLLAVQGALKSLFQCHCSKASVLLVLSFLSPTLTSIYDYWKNHSCD